MNLEDSRDPYENIYLCKTCSYFNVERHLFCFLLLEKMDYKYRRINIDQVRCSTCTFYISCAKRCPAYTDIYSNKNELDIPPCYNCISLPICKPLFNKDKDLKDILFDCELLREYLNKKLIKNYLCQIRLRFTYGFFISGKIRN